jgi:hypothetical protein
MTDQRSQQAQEQPRCSRCGRPKMKARCGPCGAAAKRERRKAETPEQRARRLAQMKAYASANRDRIAEYKAQWRRDNAEHVAAQMRSYYQTNGEKIRARVKAWRESNSDRKSAANREWNEKNPEKALASYRRSKAKRRKDAKVRIAESFSEQIRRSLRDGKSGRRWEALAGYTVEHLATHIERQFIKGMSWGNYGSAWHIDHIIPQASFRFDSADDPEFKACWALTNLRPLWAKVNAAKRDKRLFLV